MEINTRTTDDPIEILTTDEESDLKDLEAIIERGQRTFIEVGLALVAIKKDRLYRATHATWEAYLADRWPELTRRGGDRLIAAAEVNNDLGPIGLTLTNESQARPLTSLGPDQRRAAYASATDAAGGKPPTGKQVEAAAAAYKLPRDYQGWLDRAATIGITITVRGGDPDDAGVSCADIPALQRALDSQALEITSELLSGSLHTVPGVGFSLPPGVKRLASDDYMAGLGVICAIAEAEAIHQETGAAPRWLKSTGFDLENCADIFDDATYTALATRIGALQTVDREVAA